MITPPRSLDVVSIWGSSSPETSTSVVTWPVLSGASTRRSVATLTSTLLVIEVWKPVCVTVTE